MLKYLSISQLNLHKKNPRRWILEYVEGIRLPPSPHLSFGTDIHDFLEDLISGNARESELSKSNEEFLRKWYKENTWIREVNWRIEDKFESWIDPRIPPFRGRIDLWSYNDIIPMTCVLDHKTVTKGYEETTESLKKNWQLSLYAYVISPLLGILYYDDSMWEEEVNDSPVASVGHNQFFKDKEFNIVESKTIRTHLTRKELYDNMEDIRKESRSLIETYENYKKNGMSSVRYTPENKWWYGKPCEFWPCIDENETVEECRKRIGGLREPFKDR